MSSPHPELSRELRALLAAVGGALWATGYPSLEWGPVPVVAGLVLLFVALGGCTVRAGFWYGYLYGCVGMGAGFYWLWNVFGPPSVALIAVSAVFVAVFGMLGATLLRELSWWRLAALAPAWVGVEFLRCEVGPLSNGTLALGYSAGPGPLMDLGRWLGVYGASLALASCAAALFGLRCALVCSGRGLVRAFALSGAVAGALVLWGTVSPVPRGSGPSVTVLAVQAERASLDRLFELSEAGLRSARAAGKRVDLVAWPENAVRGVFLEEAAPLRARLGEFARRHGVHLSLGNERRAPGNSFFNTIFLITPDGSVGGHASKSKPVPFLNDGLPTLAPEPVATATMGKVGFPVCYDADFSLVDRGVVARGAEFLVIPTRDHEGWGEVQHRQRVRMLRWRAVECGRFVLRVASSGPTVVVAPDGSYREAKWDMGEGTLLATLERRLARTPYVQWGYALGPLCLGVAVGLAVLLRKTVQKS